MRDAANRSLRGIERTAQFVTRAFAGLAAIQLGRRFLQIADEMRDV